MEESTNPSPGNQWHSSRFQAQVVEYQPLLEGFLIRNCGFTIEEAQDVAQETWNKVLKALDNGHYEERGKFLSWIIKIAMNTALNYIRKEHRSSIVEMDTFAVSETVLEMKGQLTETQEWLVEAINETLSDLQVNSNKKSRFLALRLFYKKYCGSGRAYELIAAELGKTKGAIKSLIHDAKIGLRKALLQRLRKELAKTHPPVPRQDLIQLLKRLEGTASRPKKASIKLTFIKAKGEGGDPK